MSYGLFSIQPKNEQGEPIDGVKSALIPPHKHGQKELKAWVALIDHIARFRDTDNNGMPDIPVIGEYEEAPIVEVDSLSPYYLFKNATIVQWTASSLFIILTILGFFLALKLYKWSLRRK